jgi:hypothetical protein
MLAETGMTTLEARPINCDAIDETRRGGGAALDPRGHPPRTRKQTVAVNRMRNH